MLTLGINWGVLGKQSAWKIKHFQKSVSGFSHSIPCFSWGFAFFFPLLSCLSPSFHAGLLVEGGFTC